MLQQINQLLQEQLAAVGIRLKLEPVAQSEWYDRLVKRTTNMSPNRWTQRPDPDGLLYILFHSTGFANTSGYKNEQVDKLLEEGRNIYDQAARKKIYDALQEIIVKDIPMFSLFYSVEYAALRDTRAGLRLDSRPDPAFPRPFEEGALTLVSVRVRAGTPRGRRGVIAPPGVDEIPATCRVRRMV